MIADDGGPERIDDAFVKALNAGDLDALVSLYEPEASLMPSPGNVVRGRPAIREALSQFLDAKPAMAARARTLAQAGDVALVTATWELALATPGGERTTMTGQSVEVVRRQADGRWLFAIDFPFGVAG